MSVCWISDILPQLLLISQSDRLICRNVVGGSPDSAALVNVPPDAFFSSLSAKKVFFDLVIGVTRLSDHYDDSSIIDKSTDHIRFVKKLRVE